VHGAAAGQERKDAAGEPERGERGEAAQVVLENQLGAAEEYATTGGPTACLVRARD
jgi:hypothetical protein